MSSPARHRPCFRPGVLAVLALTVFTTPLPAQDAAQPEGWSGGLGLGMLTAPTYDGSPNSRTNPVPVLSLSYHSARLGTFSLDETGLSWIFLDAGGLQLGVLTGFDPGRKSGRQRNGPFTQGDDRLLGMGDVSSSWEGGAMLAWGPLNLVARHAIGDKGHDGFIATLGIGWETELASGLGLRIGAGTSWADRRYMQTYYGVTPQQAAASRFAAYAPRAGITSGEVSVGAQYRFAKRWLVQAGLTWRELVDEAGSSPLAEDRASMSAFGGVAWTFE